MGIIEILMLTVSYGTYFPITNIRFVFSLEIHILLVSPLVME